MHDAYWNQDDPLWRAKRMRAAFSLGVGIKAEWHNWKAAEIRYKLSAFDSFRRSAKK